MAGASVEPFYGAAARSMSESWHDFIFGAFDPAGIVTIDKLPGAVWMQALSLRIFGFHIWALVLPQVVEGVLTILVLYRAVRRLAGPAAGLTAAAVLAVTPITVLLGRGNVSDSLLILLLVLAADATSAALLTGSLGQLLLAGVWVGLAFQAKMIQAWLALPALAAAYLLAAPAARLRTRCAHVALAGLVTAVVSLSWMTAVSLVPSRDRPYVDGSPDDSVYTQVFDYNGLGRLTGNWATLAGPPSPLVIAAAKSGQLLTAETRGIKPGWHRLLAGPFAADSGWLLPAAVAGALGVLIARRRQGRRDPLRAAVVLWGGWWLVLAVFFSVGTYLNSYYVAALIPAVAALCGTGIAACGPRPWPARLRLIAAATVLGCAGYGAYVMFGTASGPVVLTVVALIVAAAAAALLLLPASGMAGHLTAVAFAGAAVLLLPAAASVSCVIREMGPFDTPFESSKTAHNNQALAAAVPTLTRAVQRLERETPPGDALFGTDTSGGLAQDFILYSGREVLPIGGFLGNVPAPTLATLQADISRGYVRLFLLLPVSPPGPDPRVRWIESHCTRLPRPPDRRPAPYANFFCGPGPVSRPARAATGIPAPRPGSSR
ncbi:MAG: glycosyltransferase family 39 protein [Streptosporangiaceae bacterium]